MQECEWREVVQPTALPQRVVPTCAAAVVARVEKCAYNKLGLIAI